MHDFQVGDRVRVVSYEDTYPTLGLTGIVVYASPYRVGVQHDKTFRGGHSCATDGIALSSPLRGLWYYSPAAQLVHQGISVNPAINIDDILK